MQKVNILYIITKLELGGAQKQLLNLISNLDRERFTIFLLTAQEGLLLRDFLSIDGLTLRRSIYLERAINPIKDFLALIEIYKYIKENKIDIVHTHSSKAGILGRLAARLAKVKFIVHTVHGWSFNDFQSALIRIFYIWLERFTASFTSILIAVSRHDMQKGVELGIAEAHKYKLIRYGIDYSEFSKKEQDLKEKLGINNSNLVVGMVSCFKPQKSPQDFIKLASAINKILPDIKFILVGDGTLRKRVQGLINRFHLKKSVILAGWRRDIWHILSSIDVLVLTSLWEGLPIVVLEAMSASLPVVVTDTGGVREVVIDGKTGFLVKPHGINSMSNKLSLLLKDKNLRQEMGKNAKKSLGFEFSLSNMVENTQNLYLGLLQENTKNASLSFRLTNYDRAKALDQKGAIC
jgi:glycosyltransferase involved in cell wall biosynthesis